MTVLDRIFLGICAVVLAVLAGLLVSTVFGSGFLVDWLQSANFAFDGAILTLILVLLAIYLVILLSKVDRKKFIVYPRELGVVKISAECVESLIVEAAAQISGVQEVRALFTDVVDPRVTLKVVVYPDHNLSDLSEELQASVKAYVEKTVGITIQEIEVSVVGISKRTDTELHGLI
ncbi:MAG: alkaline shock response membrane anchor protein AmaP [Firmicutes bacterium]|nr:alkaline shock response membrane anchor protein AmaP [Bacillota bacterium]